MEPPVSVPRPEFARRPRDGGAGAAARTAWAAREIVRIVSLLAERAVALGTRPALRISGSLGSAHAATTAGPLVQVYFREDDAASVAKLFDHVSVVGRNRTFEQLRARGGREIVVS